mmetsp:Transcript_17584/g.15863  ORF Transcript_17584/g.15863 Transcript_17584/m.15863 type:complete len:371 (+) Transcript_17584:65-1177(+)
MSDEELINRFIVPRLKDYDVEYIRSCITSLSGENKLDVINKIDSYINRETFIGYYFKKFANIVNGIPAIEREDVLARSDPYIDKATTSLTDICEIVSGINGIPVHERDDVLTIAQKYHRKEFKPWEIRDLVYSIKNIPLEKRQEVLELADEFLVPGPNSRQRVCITINYIKNLPADQTILQKKSNVVKYLTEICSLQVNDDIICNVLCEAVVVDPSLISKFSGSIVSERIQSLAFLRAAEAGQFNGIKALFNQGFITSQDTLNEVVIRAASIGSTEIVEPLVTGMGVAETYKDSITDEITKILVTNNLFPSPESIRISVDKIVENCRKAKEVGLEISHFQNVLPFLQTALKPLPGNEDEKYVEKMAEYLP